MSITFSFFNGIFRYIYNMKNTTWLSLAILLLPLWCLAQVPAYYNTINFSLSGNALKNQLSSLIINTHTTVLPYTSSTTLDVWDALQLTDVDPDNPNNVLLIYGWEDNDSSLNNDRTRGKYSTCHSLSCNNLWVREHVFPKSRGIPNLGTENAGSDAHHLRPTDYDRNNLRSNYKFGDAILEEASYITISNTWYPGEEWRGDVARMMMYMYVRYPTQCAATAVGAGSTSYSPFADMPNVFLDWNAQDPVSQVERNRNNILNNLQGNRNPFIDNPYLATKIWNGPQAADSWGTLNITSTDLSQVYLYPTRTTGDVYVASPFATEYQYAVYTPFGQLLQQSTTSDVITITDAAKGLYFITLEANGLSKTFKVLKE